MFNFDDVTKENIKKKHNPKWPQIPDHSYKILIIAGSESGATNALLRQIKQQDDDNYSIIDKIYLYVKDPNEAKYGKMLKEMVLET